MRQPEEIAIGEKTLDVVLKEHMLWLRDEDGGHRADLRGAYLRDADLRDADLRDADLRDADLRGANLTGAYLRDADLRDADLTGADLRDADLTGAYLTGAYLRDAKGILSVGPIGSRADMLYAVQHKTEIMVKAGCFWGTLAEFEERVEQVHGENEHGKAYQAAIVFIKAILTTGGQAEPESLQNE